MAKKQSSITRKAKRAAEKWRAYWQFNTNQYNETTTFVLGQQWKDEESAMLKTYKKVPMQVNKLATLVNTMLGEQQQNTPQIQVVPLENCDQEVAKIRELIVKDIMFHGNSKEVYQICAQQAFIGGFSGYAVLTDYCHPKSFDLDIYYLSFKDPTKCYWDVSAEDISKTDGMYCGWLTRMSRAKFRDIYGSRIEEKILPDDNKGIAASQEEVAAVSAPGTQGSQFIWADDDCVTIQHHFEKKSIQETLYKLSNGHICNEQDMEDIVANTKRVKAEQQEAMIRQRMAQIMQQQQQPQAQANPAQMQDPNMAAGQYDPLLGQQSPDQSSSTDSTQLAPPNPEDMQFEDDVTLLYDGEEPVRIESEKQSEKYEITHYKMCGEYVLDQTIFPSEQLPLVFVDQCSYYDKNGKQFCRPFVIDAMDTQKYLNYLATQSAYVLKVSRYDQWIGSKKNVSSQDTQQRWRDPLTEQGMLTFDESPSGIVPQRINPPELSQSLLTQYQRAMDDLYTSTGLYPTRLGQTGNEVSGAAIDARTRQGSYSTYVAFNSINRAIAKGGEIVNELIPAVYDSTRVIALMTPDEGLKNITVNLETNDYGEQVENDIRKGSYQVRLVPGPSYEGQKEQALDSLNMAIQAAPESFPMIADLYAENLPLANTIELKNRFKTLVPPGILEAGKTGKAPPQQPQQPSPEQMQAEIAQQELQLKQKEIVIKQQELQLSAQKQNQEAQLKMQELEQERLQIAAELKSKQLEYIAEVNRTQNETHQVHATNMANILTHMGQPQQPKNTQ